MKSSSLWRAEAPLVLGSGSATRRLLLEACGIPFRVIPPRVDERAIAAALLEQRSLPSDIAVALAHAKAEAISRQNPDVLILAADQTLDHAGSLFMKPADRQAARSQLQRLRGTEHQLHSAAVLRQGDEVLWAGISSASLIMREFSDHFLDLYLDEMGDRALQTVGGYEIEGLGAHLFSEVVGDHATILGLPLLGLLHALRDLGKLEG
jgi:septum formation protein